MHKNVKQANKNKNNNYTHKMSKRQKKKITIRIKISKGKKMTYLTFYAFYSFCAFYAFYSFYACEITPNNLIYYTTYFWSFIDILHSKCLRCVTLPITARFIVQINSQKQCLRILEKIFIMFKLVQNKLLKSHYGQVSIYVLGTRENHSFFVNKIKITS